LNTLAKREPVIPAPIFFHPTHTLATALTELFELFSSYVAYVNSERI